MQGCRSKLHGRRQPALSQPSSDGYEISFVVRCSMGSSYSLNTVLVSHYCSTTALDYKVSSGAGLHRIRNVHDSITHFPQDSKLVSGDIIGSSSSTVLRLSSIWLDNLSCMISSPTRVMHSNISNTSSRISAVGKSGRKGAIMPSLTQTIVGICQLLTS